MSQSNLSSTEKRLRVLRELSGYYGALAKASNQQAATFEECDPIPAEIRQIHESIMQTLGEVHLEILQIELNLDHVHRPTSID